MRQSSAIFLISDIWQMCGVQYCQFRSSVLCLYWPGRGAQSSRSHCQRLFLASSSLGAKQAESLQPSIGRRRLYHLSNDWAGLCPLVATPEASKGRLQLGISTCFARHLQWTLGDSLSTLLEYFAYNNSPICRGRGSQPASPFIVLSMATTRAAASC